MLLVVRRKYAFDSEQANFLKSGYKKEFFYAINLFIWRLLNLYKKRVLQPESSDISRIVFKSNSLIPTDESTQ